MPTRAAITAVGPPVSSGLPFAFPLDEFYLRAGISLPRIERIDGESVPEPYKSLLVHSQDMTPTLEQYHGDTLHLQVLRSEVRNEFYFREVVLKLDGRERPVEFGAIRIDLSLFAAGARQLILAEHLPLGHILKDCAVAHSSRPKAFLRVASDEFMNRVLELSGANTLYGRRNTLLDPQQRALAEIVEILPPIDKPGAR
jgi:chorismate-pyruvate lyase